MSVFVITTGVTDYDGSWTNVLGITYDEEVAKRIVADRTARIAAAIANRETISEHMRQWDLENRRPAPMNLRRLTLPYEHVQKKLRTPEMIAANQKARRDYDEAAADAARPYQNWANLRYVEQLRFTEETFSEAERNDMRDLSRDEVCEYEETVELS